ncbi:hypothetical protein MD588_09630 [Photobacterium sp. SDRW27]|uniref:hypothetical protein n=1 Tax=Photobacterium obscurum TaxID=2829490 RepID=UPI00224472AC|nr:hypothetical protein [Photobacterium obscurum]MCW8329067.1 hypothetical protein [Photobacterium obscurum]
MNCQLKVLVPVVALTLGLVGCGGGGSGKKTAPDNNGGKVNPPAQNNVYPEGVYLTTLAGGNDDISRDADSSAKYVGVGFAFNQSLTPGKQELYATLREVAPTDTNAPGWYNVQAERANRLDHNIEIEYCYDDAVTGCFAPEEVSTEMGGGWIAALSDTHQAQMVNNQLAEGLSPVYGDKGFMIQPDDRHRSRLLFVQTDTSGLSASLFAQLIGSQWQAPEAYTMPSNYTRYAFSHSDSGTMAITASMVDENNVSQCTVVSTEMNVINAKFMLFEATMASDVVQPCKAYLDSLGDKNHSEADLSKSHEMMASFVKDGNSDDILALMHVADDSVVSGPGLFIKQ